MVYINEPSLAINSYYNIIEKFMQDLNLTQEMSAESSLDQRDRIREPEIPSSGPVTSFGRHIPKVWGRNYGL